MSMYKKIHTKKYMAQVKKGLLLKSDDQKFNPRNLEKVPYRSF